MDDEKNDAIKDEPVEAEEKDLPISPENNAPSEPEQKDDSSPLTEATNSEAQQDAPVNAEASPPTRQFRDQEGEPSFIALHQKEEAPNNSRRNHRCCHCFIQLCLLPLLLESSHMHSA